MPPTIDHTSEEKMLAHLGKIVLYVFPCIYKFILSKVNQLNPFACRSIIHNNDLKRKLSNEEKVILQDLQTTGYSAFTLQLCYKFFIHFEWFEPPTQSWGKEPTVDDIALADDIERIRRLSNKIHLLDLHTFSQDVYNQYFKNVRQVCERIELLFDVPGNFSSEIEPDDKITTKQVVELFESLKKYEEIPDNPFPSNIFIQGRSRYARFGLVVVEMLPKLIREIIGNSIPPRVLLNQINAARRNDPSRLDKIISHDERVCLNTLRNGTYKDLDFTTIYKLIRSFALVDTPAQGWGKQPMIDDTAIADDIERLRIRRNYIVHNISTNISQTKFDEYFSYFIEIAMRVDTYLGKTSVTGFETEVHHYKICSIDYDLEQKYTQALQEIEDIKYRFTEGRIHFYYGKNFERFIETVKAESAKYEKRKIIIVIEEDEDAIEKTRLLNALKTEIDTGRISLERVETGSLTLFLDVLDIVITSESFRNEFGNFIEHILTVLYSGPGAKQQTNVVMMESEDCCELNFVTDDENVDTCTTETPVDKKSIRYEVNVNSELFQSYDLLHTELAHFFEKASDTNGTGQKSEVSAIMCSNVSEIDHEGTVKLAKVKTDSSTDEDSLKDTMKTTQSKDSNEFKFAQSAKSIEDNNFRGTVSTVQETKFFQLIKFSFDLSAKVTRTFIKTNVLINYNNSFVDFLNANKHEIYHLWSNNIRCCNCSSNVLLQQYRGLNKDQFTKLFDINGIASPGHLKKGNGNCIIQHCICGISCIASCSLDKLDDILIHTLLRKFVKLSSDDDLWLNTVRTIRNNLAHPESTTCFDQGRLEKWWSVLEASVLGLASKIPADYYVDMVEEQIKLLSKIEFKRDDVEIQNLIKRENKKLYDQLKEHDKILQQILEKQEKYAQDTRDGAEALKDEIIKQLEQIKDHLKIQIKSLTFPVQLHDIETVAKMATTEQPESQSEDTEKVVVQWRMKTSDAWDIEQIKQKLDLFSTLLSPTSSIEFIYAP